MGKVEPTHIETEKLVLALQRNEFQLCEEIANEFTVNYPQFALGWNILGIALAQTGRPQDSVPNFLKTVELEPHNFSAHTNLGNVYKALGRREDAMTSYRFAIAQKPDNAALYFNLATVLTDPSELEEAEKCYREAIRLQPHFTEAYSNLGNVLRKAAKLKEATKCYREAIRINKNFVSAYINLAATLRELDDLEEAEAVCRQALVIDPNSPEAYFNLAAIFKGKNNLQVAEQLYRSALKCRPDYHDALLNLGSTLEALGRVDEAKLTFSQAVTLSPDSSEAHFSLGVMHSKSGDLTLALVSALTAHRLKNDWNTQALLLNTRTLLVEGLTRTAPNTYLDDQAEIVTKALEETWCRPNKLGRFTQALLLKHNELRSLVERGNSLGDLLLYEEFIKLIRQHTGLRQLIEAFLRCTTLSNIELEVFFTNLRKSFLEALVEEPLKLTSDEFILSTVVSLSMHCFINEYVFWSSDSEQEMVSKLTKKMLKNVSVATKELEVTLAVLGSYTPLTALCLDEKLIGETFSSSMKKLIRQQVEEPLIELKMRQKIPSLTEVDNEVSELVKDQYEENPYPRWVSHPNAPAKETVNGLIRRRYPNSNYVPLADDDIHELLIAGCGTGQHPIGSALSYSKVNVLAVDISIASLAYAQRKASELSIENITFARADILRLAEMGRLFDIIEAVGVLHHMSDPYAAWDMLLGLLKPNGLMRIGLYSTVARRNISLIRYERFLNNIRPTAREIARVRQEIIVRSRSFNFGWILASPDFYSTSGCRDLLFHVHECPTTLPAIKSYLFERNLRFLGFDIDEYPMNAYREKFPEDIAATNLDNWNIFEQEVPDLFRSMYQLWVQKL